MADLNNRSEGYKNFAEEMRKLGNMPAHEYADAYAQQYNINPETATTPQEETGFLNAIGRGLTSGAAGVVQGQAQLGNLFGVGDGQLAQYLQGVNERNARKKEYTIADMIPFATDYWTNPEGMTYDVSNLLGSSGAMMAETGALMTGVGAVGGRIRVGGEGAACG